nr:TIM barrel protein [Streptomyces sp. uw30]
MSERIHPGPAARRAPRSDDLPGIRIDRRTPGRRRRPGGTPGGIDLLRRALRIAADLGSPTVHLCSGPAPKGLDEQDAWKRLAAGIEAVLESAEKYGVALAFEPAPNSRCWWTPRRMSSICTLRTSEAARRTQSSTGRSSTQCA